MKNLLVRSSTTATIGSMVAVFFALFFGYAQVSVATIPDLVFSSAADNDLYQAANSTFQTTYARHGNPLDAVNAAPNGAGVMILADGYPDFTTSIQQQVVNVASAKNLKLYIEFPGAVPGLSLGSPFRNSVERIVTDTNSFFGASLQQWDILDAHEAMFVNVNTSVSGLNQHLRLAKVAGYENAVFGYSGTTTRPMLFEHANSGVDMLISTTKMSNFVTGRYMPNEKWMSAWSGVLQFLDPSATQTDLQWTPVLSPTYNKTESLPATARRDAVNRGVQWYSYARLLIHEDWLDEYLAKSPFPDLRIHQPWTDPANPVGNGLLGVLEGTANPIYDNGGQALRWYIRNDVVGPSAMAFAMHGRLFDDDQTRQIARNLIAYMDDPNNPLAGGSKSDPNTSAYGLRGWNATTPFNNIVWSDDNARSLLGQIGAAAALETQNYNEQIVTKILSTFRLTGTNGYWTASALNTTALGSATAWQSQHANTVIRAHPHYEAYKWAGFLWLYGKTGDADLLTRTKTGITHVMNAYNNGTLSRTNGLQQERARMLLPLAWLVRVDDTPQHRAWLQQIFADILADMDASGAIAEDLGAGGSFQFPPPGSNAAFGGTEAPVIQQNGDPGVDLLYTSNFALKGLVEAAAATGDQQYIDAANLLGDFMIRVQTDATISELDGKWTRGFDFDRWDYWGSDSDLGWGVLGDQAGWTSAEIITGLTLLEMGSSVWDMSDDIDVSEFYPKLKTLMFTTTPFDTLDLDLDGDVDIDDYTDELLEHLGLDVSEFTPLLAGRLGDLNGDSVIDLGDFLIFRTGYDQLHGSGSFDAALRVPEPATFFILAALAGGCAMGRRRRSRRSASRRSPLGTVRTTHALWPLALLVTFGLACPDARANVLPYSYTYDAGTIANVQLAGDTSATANDYVDAIALNDGEISPHFPDVQASPCCAWDIGGKAILFGRDGSAFAQPGLTLDLGEQATLDSIDVHYIVRTQSGVQAPDFLNVSVDGNALPQFNGFDNTPIPVAEGSRTRVATINLAGLSGQQIHLDFRNFTGSEGGAGFWTGLTEIVVNGGPTLNRELTLIVNKATGDAMLKNTGETVIDLAGYGITSASGSLDLNQWNSLQDQDYEGNGPPGDGNGWEEGGASNAKHLIEAYLLGSSTLTTGDAVSLGAPFDPNGSDDLALRFADSGALQRNGVVRYITCDFDDDGDCDSDDVDALTLVGDLVTGVASPPADGKFDLNVDANVDGSDLTQWLADAATSRGHASPFLVGDLDLDHDVDTVDITSAIVNFTGAGGAGMKWSLGDGDGDGDVDTLDLTTILQNFTGAAADGDGAQAAVHVEYDELTGDLRLGTDHPDATDAGTIWVDLEHAVAPGLSIDGLTAAVFGDRRVPRSAGSLTFTIVPEPSTICLAALTSIFLRRVRRPA